MSNSHDQLERDLRAALRSVDHVPVSRDAWQQNQRRLRESGSRRGHWVLAAAAVVLVVLLVGGLLAALNGRSDSGTPANGRDDGTSDSMSSDDMFAEENLLGPIVELETLQVGGDTAVHEAALTDTSGKGPSLCDRLVITRMESGGCGSREPSADKPEVAFDWLTGVHGDGTTGVLGGVDGRVLKVQVWLDNGDMTLANLKPSGWEGTKLFALTVPAEGPRPQRLVAYSDASGTVLQAVDMAAHFGDSYRRAEPDCGNREDAPTLTHLLGPNESTERATVRFGYATANVHVVTGGLGLDSSTCLTLKPGAIAGASVAGSIAVVVVAPEVSKVRVRSLDRDADVELLVPERTLWRMAVAHDLAGHDLNRTEVIAYDGKGNELGREFLNQPASP